MRRGADSKTEVIGGNTMLGMLATFISTLHISYHEAFDVIPYRNLLIMMKDIQKEVSSDMVVHHKSGRERLEQFQRERE